MMTEYYDSRRDRTLVGNGLSEVNDGIPRMCEIIIEKGCVPFHYRFGRDLNPFDTMDIENYISHYQDGRDGLIAAKDIVIPSGRRKHSDGDVERVYRALEASQRLQYHPLHDDVIDRVTMEMEFFERDEYIVFLLQIKELIDRFKDDGVLWGVGRGSSCASFVLYCLEVHDIDPVLFDIPFHEFSKQKEE